MSKTKTICISGMVMALYIVTMLLTAGFAFGAYQVRIATALYSLSYVFPFLVLPLALANTISNMNGPLGMLDVIGGFFIGVITAGGVFLVKKLSLPRLLIIFVIIVAPALIVPIWLSYVINVPYIYLVVSIAIGQTLPAIAGYFLTFAVERIVKYEFKSFGRGK
ncbi:MAG: QueT transporter family protein [Defluviitaleaceae bacterium]|nr:QueT transporter family protein [Defluviitaleaceae bacterium]